MKMWKVGFNKKVGKSICGPVIQELRMVDGTTVPSFIRFDYS